MPLSLKAIGFMTIILLGVILAFSPVDSAQHKSTDTAQVLKELQSGTNYIQPEELAHWIIDKDPDIQIIDLRNNTDFEKYHIPGALQFPLSKLSDKTELDVIDEEKTNILVSNGNTRAGQAWLILKQMGYDNVYILAGGLNYWVKVFNNPAHPPNGATDDEIFTYQFRKAAGAVMMGKSLAVSPEQTNPIPAKKKPVRHRIRKKASKAADEGC